MTFRIHGLPRADFAPLFALSDEALAARGVEYVDYAGWKALDEHEVAQGAAQGRPRIKETRVENMLAIVRKAKG